LLLFSHVSHSRHCCTAATPRFNIGNPSLEQLNFLAPNIHSSSLCLHATSNTLPRTAIDPQQETFIGGSNPTCFHHNTGPSHPDILALPQYMYSHIHEAKHWRSLVPQRPAARGYPQTGNQYLMPKLLVATLQKAVSLSTGTTVPPSIHTDPSPLRKCRSVTSST
jgi:hypothetical protein